MIRQCICIFLASLIFFSSCSQYSGRQFQETSNFDGVQIFDGIFFAQGPVAANLPVLEEQMENFEAAPIEEQKKLRDIEIKVLNHLEENFPGYLKDLESAFYSQNQIKIKEAIALGSDILIESAYEIKEVRKALLSVFPDDLREIMNNPEERLYDEEGNISQEKVHNLVPEEYHELIDHTIATAEHGNRKGPPVTAFAIVCNVYFAITFHNTVALTAAVFVGGVIFGALAVKFTIGEQSTSGEDSSSVLYGNILVNQIAEKFAR